MKNSKTKQVNQNQTTPQNIENLTTNDKNLLVRQVIEVALLTASAPLSITELYRAFDNTVSYTEISNTIQEISREYLQKGMELLELENGSYRLRSAAFLQPYLNKVYAIKPLKTSRALLETLAIIAYYQPVTRGDIENIRGVAVNHQILQNLNERGWIEVIGTKELPGKPELFATTNNFLHDFGISSLEQLPPLPDVNLRAPTMVDFLKEYDKRLDLTEDPNNE